MAKKVVCNMCGNEFDMFDLDADNALYKHLGYGSKYDGDYLKLDICCKCLDTIIDQCSIRPIETDTMWGEY